MALTINNSNSLTLLNILNRTSASQSDSLTRLSTGSRINKGADDPAGLIAMRSLESNLRGVESAISNNQRTDSMLSVADNAFGQISSLLNDVQRLAQASANSAGLSADELAANQSQIDNAISAIDRIVRTTEFNGKKLLDGSLGINVSGVSSSNITDVRVFNRDPNSSSTSLTVTLQSAAERAALTSVIANSSLGATTITIQGARGSATIEVLSSENLSSVTAKINAATAQTGVVASQTSATAAIALRSENYGADEFARVTVLSGGTLYGSGSVSNAVDYGLDASVTVNGQSTAVDGLNVNFSNGELNISFNITEAFNSSSAGTSSSFSVTTGGATFQLGIGTDTKATIGIDGLFSQQLGSATLGYLSSLKSGGANSVINNATNASAIAAEASKVVAKAQGRIGGFQKFQVKTAMSQMTTTKESLSSALSTIKDVDYATETANLNQQNVLLQSAISLLGLANQQSSQILALLR